MGCSSSLLHTRCQLHVSTANNALTAGSLINCVLFKGERRGEEAGEVKGGQGEAVFRVP